MRFLKVFLSSALIINCIVADETEEIVSVASYINSSEFNASPVDVISADEFKNLIIIYLTRTIKDKDFIQLL